MSSADNFCKQFGPRSGPTECRAWSWSKMFDTLMVFLIEIFKKVDFEKDHQTTKKNAKFPRTEEAELIIWVSYRNFGTCTYHICTKSSLKSPRRVRQKFCPTIRASSNRNLNIRGVLIQPLLVSLLVLQDIKPHGLELVNAKKLPK